jgi:hypothetical protein
MTVETESVAASPEFAAAGGRPPFAFEASDATGSFTIEARDVQPATPAGAVARALAGRMQLPNDVPWTLVDEQTGAFLDESRPIGDQIATGSRVSLTPKSHLG